MQLPVSTIGDLIKIAAESKGIISLGPGEPDFGSPKNIINFACRKLREGFTHYSPPGGRSELKEAIVKKLKMDNKINVSPDHVIVTCGSTEAILLNLICTIDPGEGVLIPDPGFLAYKPVVEILNGMPLSIPHCEKDGFQFNIEEAKRVIIPERTNVMIINSPSNPTGVVFKRKVLEEIADFACEYDLIVLSDEAYEKLVYDDEKHISIGSLNGMGGRVITLQSFSKTYAMPGFRVGYAVGPEELINAMKKVHIYSSICAPTVSQLAAVEALKGSQSSVKKMVKEYDRRRKLITKRLNEIPGFSCVKPKGAFYAFPNIKNFGMKSLAFSKWLIKKGKVATVPGTEFGRCGEGYIRCSYATSYEKIEEAMNRVEGVSKKLKVR
ncbi:MAG: aminotransferase class I/II-fold pyridoxal phosphate-dependent enzyme [Candidatus Aenigmarchaeota archaeon]|nr:aminotransferase class I/II-fold pyridoxal phosphate-dependent enzyme [Candidatus Aenigmarchaeota archaeon]